jgi:hypothetical protein
MAAAFSRLRTSKELPRLSTRQRSVAPNELSVSTNDYLSRRSPRTSGRRQIDSQLATLNH